ncbi:MAG: response regulator receiver domain [Alphaproteobacteria bacterium]
MSATSQRIPGTDVPSLKPLIETTYIKPIRTVIAVDDQFPTLDKLLEAHKPARDRRSSEFRWNNAGDEVKSLLGLLTIARERKWIFDVHDGIHDKDDKGDIDLRRLHQTDLLILDYFLDGEGGGPDRSLETLGLLALNPRFNLVVVYTSHDIHQAFRRILLSFLPPLPRIDPAKTAAVEDIWDDWAIAHKEDIRRFESQADESWYLAVRREINDPDFDGNRASAARRALEEPNFLGDLGRFFGERKKDPSDDLAVELPSWNDLIAWFIQRSEDKLGLGPGVSGARFLRWGDGRGQNWIRLENLFVTVVKKGHSGGEVVSALTDALCAWGPTPHRVLVSAMRALAEEEGGSLEDKALRNRSVQAGWLLRALSQEDAGVRNATIGRTLERLWMSLFPSIQDSSLKTMQSVYDYELSLGSAGERVKHHYRQIIEAPNSQESIYSHLNVFECSEAVSGYHLTTGHVLRIEGDIVVCLSPACDLVPDRDKKGWRNELGTSLPFIGVRLKKEEKIGPAVKGATSGRHVFLDLGEGPRAFEFVPVGKTGEPNPRYEHIYARDQGRLVVADGVSSLKVQRIRESGGRGLHLFDCEAVIIAQLRYEYALNLMDRLGANLSRVGLDFLSP